MDSTIRVPEITPAQEFLNYGPDYIVNDKLTTNFTYIDWTGAHRTVGPQKAAVRIKYRNRDDLVPQFQLIINPVTRKFTVLMTAEDVVCGEIEYDSVSIDAPGGFKQEITFVDLALMEERSGLCSWYGIKILLQMFAAALLVVIILAILTWLSYQILQ